MLCGTYKVIILIIYMENRILRFLCVQVARMTGMDINDITPETKLAELGLDSLGRFLLLMESERRFGVCLPDSLAEWPQTIDDIKTAILKAKGVTV